MKQDVQNPKTPRPGIGFRLDEESLQILVQRAALLKVSKHKLARTYVLQLLREEEERVALHEAVAGLHRQLVQQRMDFLLALEALLHSAGHASAKEAQDWVQANFR